MDAEKKYLKYLNKMLQIQNGGFNSLGNPGKYGWLTPINKLPGEFLQNELVPGKKYRAIPYINTFSLFEGIYNGTELINGDENQKMMIFINGFDYPIYDINNKRYFDRDVHRYSLQSPNYRFFEVKQLSPMQQKEIKTSAECAYICSMFLEVISFMLLFRLLI